ncbi:MAG: fasciclin domain-containing protein [Candidatus Sericytochromatia bacterium]
MYTQMIPQTLLTLTLSASLIAPAALAGEKPADKPAAAAAEAQQQVQEVADDVQDAAADFQKDVSAAFDTLMKQGESAAKATFKEAESAAAPLLKKAQQTLDKAEDQATSPTFNALIKEGDASIFLSALTRADLLYLTRDGKARTLMIPTNAAFMALPAETQQRLLSDKEMLRTVLLNHVFGGQVPAQSLRKMAMIQSASGQAIRVGVSQQQIYAGPAQVVKSNLKAGNTYVHMIDEVLLPASVVAAMRTASR